MPISKLLPLLFAVGLTCVAQSAAAQPSYSLSLKVGADAVEHGGGCRKSSPPGQCCHAGSQPYHCH